MASSVYSLNVEVEFYDSFEAQVPNNNYKKLYQINFMHEVGEGIKNIGKINFNYIVIANF